MSSWKKWRISNHIRSTKKIKPTYLSGCVHNSNLAQNEGQIIRRQTIPRPLREEGDGDDDPHPLPVPRSRKQRLPANIRRNRPIKLESSPDLLELVLHERILRVAISVVICERLERSLVFAFADEPTRRLRHEPDEHDLKNGGECL